MEFLQVAALIVATLAVGIMAGVFAIYSNAIMPGLRKTDDRTFVGAFQAIDTAIINPLFSRSSSARPGTWRCSSSPWWSTCRSTTV